jgi:hypothetical protein
MYFRQKISEPREILWFISLLIFSISIFIFFTTLFVVSKYRYEVLFVDQWMDLPHYMHIFDGSFKFGELFALHNEHRIFFPRLIFLADLFLDRDRDRINITFTILFQFLNLIVLLSVFRKTRPDNYTFSVGAGFAAILMFSLGQSQNFLFGFQVQFVGVSLAASAAFILFVKAIDRTNACLPYRRYALGAYAMLTVATFTMSNGILAGIILVMIALLTKAQTKLILQSTAVTVLLAVAYFAHYHTETQGLILRYFKNNPFHSIIYFNLYLGDVVSSLGVASVTLLGILGLAATVAGFWRVISGRERDSARLVLLAIIFFVVGTAALTAFGRSLTLDASMSLPSRYFTPAAMFSISQIFYWESVASQSSRRHLHALALSALAVFLAIGAVAAHFSGWSQSKALSHAVQFPSDALLSNVDDQDALLALFWIPKWFGDGVPFLRSHHLSLFATRDASLLGQRIDDAYAIAAPTDCRGAIDFIGPTPPTVLPPAETAKGWAWNPAENRPVDRILLTNSSGKIIGFATGSWGRTDVANFVPTGRTELTGWQGFLRADDPADTVAVAYAVLSRKKACRIGEAPVPYNYLARTPITEIGPALNAAITADDTWTINGQNAVAGPPPLAEPVHGSWSGSDSRTGEMTMGPLVPASNTLLLPMVTGPNTDGLTITISDAATGAVLSTLSVPTMTEWQLVVLPIGDDKVGRSIILKLSDQGRDWGQWFAVGLIHAPASH